MAFRVLSIDGGGIRAVLPARLLAELEALTGCAVSDQFDLIAGSSTGGVLALALGSPSAAGGPRHTAGELFDLLRVRGLELLPPRGMRSWPVRLNELTGGARVRSEPIDGWLADVLGGAPLGAARCRLLVPTYDLESSRPVVFDSAEFSGHAQPLMRELARATTALPSRSAPVRLEIGSLHRTLVHGGIAANNPALLAYAHALEQAATEEIVIVSLGAGERAQLDAGVDPDHRRRPWRWPVGRSVAEFADSAGHAHHQILRGLFASGGNEGRYWRVQPSLNGHADITHSAREDDLAELLDLAEEDAGGRRAELESIAEALAA